MQTDMTNIKEFETPLLFEKYKAEIFSSEKCSSLAKVCFGKDLFYFDTSGHTSIRDYLARDRRAGINESVCKLLTVFRKVSESVLEASDWLIFTDDVSITPDMLWICKKDGKIKLLPGCGSGYLIERLCSLAEAFPECGGDMVSEKIVKKNMEANLSIRDLLAFLSEWELELKS